MRSRSTLTVSLVSAVVALALGLGLGALLFGGSSKTDGTGGRSSSATPSTRPISLPATLDGFRDAADVAAAHGARASLVAARRRNEATVAAATSAAYARAFNGAAAAFRAYADSSLAKQLYVIAVRAPAPGLTVGPVLDPKFLGLATVPREVKTVGSMQCQIEWSPPTVAGQSPPASSEQVVSCQRSGPQLTVFVGGEPFTGPQGLSAMGQFVNAAWAAAAR